MKVLWKIINVIIVFAILPQFSCDDRVPESSIENNYKLSLEFAHPYNIESSEIVVEDLSDLTFFFLFLPLFSLFFGLS